MPALRDAVEATEALKAAYPELYLYDPTPIATATWRVGSKCIAVGLYKLNSVYSYSQRSHSA